MSIAIEEHGVYPSVPHHQDQLQNCEPLFGGCTIDSESSTILSALKMLKSNLRAELAIIPSSISQFVCSITSLDS